MPNLHDQAAADNVKVAAIQFDPQLGDVPRNLETVLDQLGTAAASDVALAVFPECALHGYVLHSRAEAEEMAISTDGPELRRFADACRELNIYGVVGYIERTSDGCYNGSALFGPDGMVGKYRKAHLPRVGVDKYVDHGDIPFTVIDTQIGKIGMLICYDLSFPEAIRCLALGGMEILAHPTNGPTGTWGPPGSRPEPEKSDPRSRSERIVIVSADRCGTERGVEFVGGSRISGPSGRILARAEAGLPAMITATVHPARTRSKHVVIPHIDLEVDYFADRRPDLYGKLVEQGETIGPPAAVRSARVR